MKVTVYVESLDEVAATSAAASEQLQAGDELEVVVGQPAPVAPRPVEGQPVRQARGHPPKVR